MNQPLTPSGGTDKTPQRDIEQEGELIAKVTAVTREADNVFPQVGGGTRHWVRECFLPVLEKHSLKIVSTQSLATKDAEIKELRDQLKQKDDEVESWKSEHHTLWLEHKLLQQENERLSNDLHEISKKCNAATEQTWEQHYEIERLKAQLSEAFTADHIREGLRESEIHFSTQKWVFDLIRAKKEGRV